ncbi:MAG TPA: aminoglycoside phosphotransferase family protein [Micromonosporaceae bacterium]
MSAHGIAVPPELAASHAKYHGDAGRAWIAALPEAAAGYLDRWDLRLDGPARHGVVALVLPVLTADGTRAVLKLSPIEEEHAGEASALRAWAGNGAVRLLDEDPATWTLLLERLDDGRSLADVPDDLQAVQVIAELLARLTALPAPREIRSLGAVAERMVAEAPAAADRLADAGERRLLARWAAAVSEIATEPGDRLLHWDLHYENVLAGDREPWLAIDPKPLAGDPGFDLLPALWNRWDEMVATGDVGRAVRRRFDLMVEVLGLDRQRAVGWTFGRVLQNSLWSVEDGDTTLDPVQIGIAAALEQRSG